MGKKEILYSGNSVITLEHKEEYAYPVIIKKASTSQYFEKYATALENEFQSIQILKDIQGIRNCYELTTLENQPALILEYIDGETLQEHISRKTLDLSSKLEIAIELAHILGKIHQKNLIHLDLNSKNILIGKEQQAVHFIDLSSSSYIDRSGQQKVQPDQELGNLSHIAPEQTGRVNRAVDERSDLYSLGVALYELMTGQLPFDLKDPMELIHHHISHLPVSPSEVSDIPKVISAIILKLLSKNAEDRYQSAAGVQADLEKCRQGLSPEDTIEEFPLGEVDYSSRFKFPQKLYGRESELKELVNAFENACIENPLLFFVAGYSGIGKTTLVEEIQRPVSEKDGYFIRGKFDQYLKTSPYTAITQAFTEFVSQILTEPEKNFNEWRKKIQTAVGDLGKVLIEVIPALEEFLGTQPDIPQLGGQEAKNRFNYVFIKFLSAAATKEHPLALFIDDLQWIDAASLKLLKVIETDFDQPGLVVIGAYRDNEVDNSHPLMDFINKREEKSMQLRLMKLNDLNEKHLKALLSDTLKTGEGIKELKEIIFEKTHGNPFFSRRLLTSLNKEGRIVYDSEINNWGWNIADIKSETIADNVVDLLAKNIAVLPEEIRKILTLAACIGNRFDIHTLTLISGLSEPEVLKLLTESLSGQYVLETGKTFEFVHDQVQQAAYSLLDENSRINKHLEIARLLLADTSESELEEKVFDIVTHYNLSVELLTNQEEKISIVELNLKAGRKARLTAAFVASTMYVRQGLSLLGESAWRDNYHLTLDVHSALIEVCYLDIQYEEVEALFDVISKNAKQDIDTGVAQKALIMSCVARHELGRAISLSESYLERLHVTLDSERESNLPITELYELPQMEDEEKLMAMEVLMAITTPVIFSVPERLPSVIYTMLNLISRYGNNTVSGFAYSWYATNLCLLQQYQEGNLFGKLAVDLLVEHPHPGRAAEIMNMQHAWIRHWRQSVHDQITPLKRHYRLAMQSGDFEWALYCQLNYTLLIWGSGKPLDYYIAKVEPSIAICQSKNQQFSLQSFLMFAQSALNLTGRSSSTTQLEGKWFSEETMMSRLEGNQMLLTLYGLLKMKLCYLFGDLGGAYDHVDVVLKYRNSLNPHYLYTKISFYGALSCVAGPSDEEHVTDRQERLGNLTLFEEELELWAESAPMNYQHQYDLVMAEKCRISDKQWEAAQLYEKAIKGAQENQFVHDEALAHELSGQFWLEQGNDKIAEMYMREALALYHRWGAVAKVDQLEERYPKWFQTESITIRKPNIPDDTGKIQTTITEPITSIQLDMESITRASQLLSAETDLEQLLSKMISLVMANSGAEKAVLLLKQENDWILQARGNSTSEEYDVLLNQPFTQADSRAVFIPESVFNYCERSKKALILDNAQLDNRFSKDKTILEHKIKSIACIPILSHGEIKAMMYLENSLMAHVFSQDRVDILNHLSSQFGISVENALLYENLNRKIAELKESEMRFRSVIENANEAIVVAQDEVVKYFNPKITELTGYASAEFRSQSFSKFIHPDDLDIVMKEYQARLSGEKKSSSYTVRILTREGQEKFVLINSTLINWDGGPATLAMIADITQLKKAESGLIKSKERFELAVSGASAGIWDWDLGTDKVYYSDRFKEHLGYTPEEIDDTPEEFWNRLHPDDYKYVRGAIDKHIEERVPYIIDYRLQIKSGEYRWFHARGQGLWDEMGNGTRMSGSLTDITKRKKAESDLRVSEERYELAVSGSEAGIWDWDMVTGHFYFSDQLQRLLGYAPGELQDSLEDLWNRLHPDDLEAAQLDLDQHLNKDKPHHSAVARMRTKSDEYCWYHSSAKAVWDESGKPIRMAGSFIDIQEQKKGEEELRKSEERFRQLMEQSPLAMEILSPDGKIKMINSAWKKMWEVSDEEAAETIDKYNMLTDPQIESLGIMDKVKEAFKGKHIMLPPIQYDNAQTVKDFDINFINEFTSPWIQCHLNAVKDSEGNIIYVVNTYVDITDLRKAEEEAKEQRDVLARIDRASSMGQLTGSIAHELNQPLTGILGNAQAAEMMLRNDASNTTELLEIMGDIVADTKRAGDVIRNLRELYREQKSEFKSVDINSIVKETLLLLHSEIIKYDIKVKNIFAANMPEISGNKVQIQQVLVNLIMNAIEAMNSIDTKNYNLTLTTECESKEVKVYIDDQGSGIDDDKIDRIFQPLATWKSGGTGMGLAISNSIIESHGGKMYAENLSGGGARIGFKLPIFNEN